MEILMLLGGHFPISGGLKKAIDLVVEAGGNTLQIFSKNPGQWRAREITQTEADYFISYHKKHGIAPVIVHDAYLINLATADANLRNKSVKALIQEIGRADLLGACCLVTHMGAHRGIGEEEGLKILSKCSGAIPWPVSVMENRKYPSSVRAPDNVTLPLGLLYFMALVSRLSTACLRRTTSACTRAWVDSSAAFTSLTSRETAMGFNSEMQSSNNALVCTSSSAMVTTSPHWPWRPGTTRCCRPPGIAYVTTA